MVGSSAGTAEEELVFVLHTPSISLDRRDKVAAKAHLLRHSQQRRRRAEAKARGSRPPTWIEFTSTIQLQSPTATIAGGQLSKICRPSGNSTDPFHVTAVGISASSHLGLLHVVFNDIVRKNFLGEAFAPSDVCAARSRTRHDHILQKRLVQCVHDELLMCSTLAYALSFQSWAKMVASNDHDADFFHLRAIQALRGRIEDGHPPFDQWFWISIYSLAITEGWRDLIIRRRTCQDPSKIMRAFSGSGLVGHKIHLNTLLQLIESSGGWDGMDPYVLESVILGDKHASFATNQPPMLRPWWDPGSLPSKFRTQFEALAHAPRPMGSDLLRELHGTEMFDIVQDAIEYLEVSCPMWSSGDVTAELEGWLSFRMHALQYRFLWAYHESKALLDRCVSLAVLTVLLSSSHGRGPRGGATWVSKQLCHALECSTEQQTGWSRGLMCWFLFTGAMVLPMCREHEYFMRRIRELGFDSGGDEVESHLGSYVYLKSRQEKQLLWLMNSIDAQADIFKS